MSLDLSAFGVVMNKAVFFLFPFILTVQNMNKSRSWDRPLRHARVISSVSKLSSRQQQSTRRTIMGLLRLQVDAATIRVEFDWIVIVEPFFFRVIVVECRRVKERKSNQVVWKVLVETRILYHWIDGTWWFTTHVRAIVLPTFTWISAEPTILANFTARTQAKHGRKEEIKCFNEQFVERDSRKIRLCVRGLSGALGGRRILIIDYFRRCLRKVSIARFKFNRIQKAF